MQVGEVLYSTNVFPDRSGIWTTWIVYRTKVDSSDFKFGTGVTDAKYIDIKDTQASSQLLEKLIVDAVQVAG